MIVKASYIAIIGPGISPAGFTMPEVPDGDGVASFSFNIEPFPGFISRYGSKRSLSVADEFRNAGRNSLRLSGLTLLPATAQDEPRIVRFVVTPATIKTGQSAVLTFQVENATTAAISGIGPVALNGALTVSPPVSTTYTLTAVSATGKSATATVLLTVIGVPPPPTVQVSTSYLRFYDVITGEISRQTVTLTPTAPVDVQLIISSNPGTAVGAFSSRRGRREELSTVPTEDDHGNLRSKANRAGNG